jgi:hypothetical protein
MSSKDRLKLHVEWGEFTEDLEGNPDDVVRALMLSLSQLYPSLKLTRQLIFQPDLTRLADSLIGLVEFAPEGILVLAGESPAEEAIVIALVGSYVGYQLGQIDDDRCSAMNLAKYTGKALKTISNQLAWMVDEGLVERVERGKYRIASLGIKRFERIASRYQHEE